MKSPDRVQILYLAGIPRTGSTVLGHALAGTPDVVFVGEMNFFWRRFAHQELCSCGMPLPECPLWSAVIEKAFGAVSPAQATEWSALEQRLVDRQRIFALIPWNWPGPASRDLRRVLDMRDQLYAAAAAEAGASWLVDGGKEPVYARIMTRLPHTDFHTVHIVRDPRGVAFSWMKRVRSDSEPGEMPSRRPIVSAAEWMLQNLMVHIGLQRRSRSYVRVRYEDLVSDLPGVVSRIAAATGMRAGPSLEPAGGGHLVAGNPGVRRQAATSIRLTLDDAWRTRLPRRTQRLVTSICGPLMLTYGYPLDSGNGGRS
jgi:Sulfotransferase family